MTEQDLGVVEAGIIKGLEHIGEDELLSLNIKYNVQITDEGLKVNSKPLNKCIRFEKSGGISIDSTFDTFYHEFVTKVASAFSEEQRSLLLSKLADIDVNHISYYIESTKVINKVY